jgi:hypothetical protein
MSIANKFRSAFRGDVSFFTLVREVLRRRKAAARRAAERRDLDEIAGTPARLTASFASLSPSELLTHFRDKPPPFFVLNEIGERSTRIFPDETAKLIETADRIVHDSVWELAGFGPLEFKGENVWRRDPLGSKDWGLDYHADVVVYSDDKADIRVLWELNRFGHAVTLACAYAVTEDEQYSETFFSQVEEWMRQNPYGRGANWNCAMETALRAINLLAAFEIFRGSRACSEQRLAMMLQLFNQHGRFTLDNNEFSYLATSNHYLSDVVGLFWIGTFLPELEQAVEWREFGLAEILREIDKQILPDGADFEASTGYHNFVAQMLLFTFLLAKKNGIDIPDGYWQKLRSMLDYIHGIIRPDGRTPLIGDADGSQIVPIVKRDSDDAAYLLALAAVVFDEPKFKEFAELTSEMLWLLGEEAVGKFNSLVVTWTTGSLAFPDAGAHVMRDGDLYLHLNANDTGVNGRGSHAHNDALSIEISAFGRAVIVDPGSYVYNLDREARHRFRSTAYHSTVMIDGEEQNTTLADLPFILGNEAGPKGLEWRPADERDVFVAEHFGYTRLPRPMVHRRTIEFDKIDKYWLIKDELAGDGEHEFVFSFHIAPGLVVEHIKGPTLKINDGEGPSLIIRAIGIEAPAETIAACVSRNYGDSEDSSILRWQVSAAAPSRATFIVMPCGPSQNIQSRLELLARLADNIGK